MLTDSSGASVYFLLLVHDYDNCAIEGKNNILTIDLFFINRKLYKSLYNRLLLKEIRIMAAGSQI